MKRRAFLQTIAAPALAAGQANRPNILFVMPDQWRGADLGSMGNKQIRTPNLDNLARDGVQFPNAVANCPVCTPARSILLTGKYPHETGTGVNDAPLPSQETSIAEILGQRGYYTGFVGKWHLEGGKRQPGFVPPGPRRQGFAFWAANICSHNYFKQHYFRDDAAPIPMPGYDAFTWTDLAIEFLGKAHAGARPFCLYLEYPSPHNPYLEPPGFEGMYDPAKIELRRNWQPGARLGSRKDIAGYYAAIACLDQQIGRLLGKVDEYGLRDNTIVVFTSDHGDMLGSHGASLKRKPWQESVGVPGIIRWPAAIRAGWRSKAPFSHVDLVPTLLGLTGTQPPAALRGFDYSDYLRGRSKHTPELAHLMIYTRTEDKQFPPWRGVRTPRYTYARHRDRRWLLYDQKKDPSELNNLVEDPACQKLIARFERAIEDDMKRTGDRWDEQKDLPYR